MIDLITQNAGNIKKERLDMYFIWKRACYDDRETMLCSLDDFSENDPSSGENVFFRDAQG